MKAYIVSCSLADPWDSGTVIMKVFESMESAEKYKTRKEKSSKDWYWCIQVFPITKDKKGKADVKS
jgi:hypothetical protein